MNENRTDFFQKKNTPSSQLNVAKAMEELEIAGQMNPGPWTQHSLYVGEAAKNIAAACGDLDTEKAQICGLLHDIGRRNGVSAMRHTIDGYDYAISQSWDDVAHVCITHSFPVKNIEADIARVDITPEQYDFMKHYLEQIEYDAYDKLIILCDALAEAGGFCTIEKRIVDTSRRYGLYPFTLERWNQLFAIRDHFEEKIGQSIYTCLPGVEKSLYR